MFSSNQPIKRRRGIILSVEGWQRLNYAQKTAETENNGGQSYTLEDLNQITGLSCHTLTKVRRRQNPVDRQTLESYFQAFNLQLEPSDYTQPLAQVKVSSNNEASPSSDVVMEKSPASFKSSLVSQNLPSLPEGQVALDSIFYVERAPEETQCYEAIMQPGSLVRIKAPRRMGKTSLVVRILNNAAHQGCQTVFLSLQLADREVLQNLDKFLQWFSASVALSMNLPNRLSDYWDELFGSKISCKIYFEQYLLTKISCPLVLALDDVDVLFDCPELAEEFFGLLRTWHEQAKNRGIWQRLRLVVAHSSEVYIPLNVNKSPFNVGLPIQLRSFNQEQINTLAQKYNLSLSEVELQELMGMVSGHPYLIQLGLYSLWQDSETPAQLLQQALRDTGIYADHLRRMLWSLEQDPILAHAFGKVIQSSGYRELELFEALKLESLGLIKLRGIEAVPSCILYRDYFTNHLRI